MSAKQHQFLSSGLPTDPANSQKCVSNFSLTWLAHQTMAFLTGQPLHAPKSWYTAGEPLIVHGGPICGKGCLQPAGILNSIMFHF